MTTNDIKDFETDFNLERVYSLIFQQKLEVITSGVTARRSATQTVSLFDIVF